MHWTAGYRRGLPREFEMALKNGNEAVLEFLRGKTVLNPSNGCREWTGPRNVHGYAYIVDPRQPINRQSAPRIVLSRFVCEMVNGVPSSDDLVARHTCDNPPCVEAAHLLWGTHQDNADDKVKRGRAAAMRGADNPRAKLDLNKIVEIKRLRESGVPNDLIAEMFGVGASTVSRAARGQLGFAPPSGS